MTLNDYFIGWGENSLFGDFLRNAQTLKTNSYPPQDIIALKDGSLLIELALAGYTKDDVRVSVEQDLLTIDSNGIESSEDHTYKHKGIAKRKFKKTYLLNKNHEVKSANMKDGLLSVVISPITPADKNIKLITVQ